MSSGETMKDVSTAWLIFIKEDLAGVCYPEWFEF